MQRNIYTAVHPIRAHWNKDWMPGLEPPKTVEEHNKAAEKYNLHPKEYKPMPDDYFGGVGDYPDLPFEGVALRDPYYPYDLPEYKRNFGEALHFDIDMLGEDRYDAGVKERYSNLTMVLSFFGIFGALIGSTILGMIYLPMFQPVMEKQMPWQGKTYYTFEKAEWGNVVGEGECVTNGDDIKTLW